MKKLRQHYTGYHSPFVLCSDEWYILANIPLPSLQEYGKVDLVENGVGQVKHFLNNFQLQSKSFPKSIDIETNITIATGTLISKIFTLEVLPVLNKINRLNVSLVPIKNHYFGESVTVSGLITGKDIISQLSQTSVGDAIWMSDRILNDNMQTLDDMTLNQLSDSLGVPLLVSNDNFIDLINNISNA